VAREIDRFLAKTPIGKYEIERDEQRREVRFTSAVASATLSFQDGLLRLDGQLGLMAMPFKGKLDEGIDRWASKLFGAGSDPGANA